MTNKVEIAANKGEFKRYELHEEFVHLEAIHRKEGAKKVLSCATTSLLENFGYSLLNSAAITEQWVVTYNPKYYAYFDEDVEQAISEMYDEY